MRPIYFMLALAVTACSISASAADVDFECGDSLFEQKEASPPRFEIEIDGEKHSYGHPIYERLWPMTLESFCRWKESDYQKVFAFCMAAIDDQPLRESLWTATGDKFDAMDNKVVFDNFTR